ncbi:MAG TPA: hypothetical protein VKK79_14475 [Candidatus Lokiarchaeia archaeon]|nr:hypothetical protein [Candidatus Lokiarchaeia archaeon]
MAVVPFDFAAAFFAPLFVDAFFALFFAIDVPDSFILCYST